jgi:hypothetical protein
VTFREYEDEDEVTVTVRRGDLDLTVALLPLSEGWGIVCAFDEDDDAVELSDAERTEAFQRADANMDETGRCE